MESSASDLGGQERPIPSELHSVYQSGPFTHCSICSQALDHFYEIQKVCRGSEIVLEMALCRTCCEKVGKEFSKESVEAMKGFLLSNFQPDEDSTHCHFCAFPRNLLRGWTLLGACRDSHLVFPMIVVCESCSENLQERLSPSTRDIQDAFVRDHFPGVPADLDLSPNVFGVS